VRVHRATQERASAFYRGSWVTLGARRPLHELTTNQKVAGSSPAERAKESPAFAGLLRYVLDAYLPGIDDLPQLLPQPDPQDDAVNRSPKRPIASRCMWGTTWL
jgi:hypothetical protein